MTNENVPLIDFSIDSQKKRRMLYFKRPKGTKIPVGAQWKCICGTVYVMTEQQEHYCQKCGSRLRHQENLDPNNSYFTCVVVHHFNLKH